ncbi:MAG: hypothetical protein ACTHOL_18140 [Luteibacter jiangsuensis]
MRQYRPSQFLTSLERTLQRWSHHAFVFALAGAAVVLSLGALRFLTSPLPPWLRTGGLVLGVVDILAWYAMLSGEAAAALVQVINRKVRDHHDRQSFDHDMALASIVRQYPVASIRHTDRWLEQQTGGMERRVSLLFGKEIAFITLLTTLLTGKANEVAGTTVAFLAPVFHTTPEMVIGALCTGVVLFVVGAFRVKARAADFGYLRYILRLASEDRGDDASPAITPDASPATSTEVQSRSMEAA